jgi:hypothetical protein
MHSAVMLWGGSNCRQPHHLPIGAIDRSGRRRISISLSEREGRGETQSRLLEASSLRESDLAIALSLGSAGGTSRDGSSCLFRLSTPLKHGARLAASLRSVFPPQAP